MKIVFTDEALRDLDAALAFTALHYPLIYDRFEARLHHALARIKSWPESAPEVAQRPGVRMFPLVRYPYKVFYQVKGDAIEILHIRHGSQQDPWDQQ